MCIVLFIEKASVALRKKMKLTILPQREHFIQWLLCSAEEAHAASEFTNRDVVTEPQQYKVESKSASANPIWRQQRSIQRHGDGRVRAAPFLTPPLQTPGIGRDAWSSFWSWVALGPARNASLTQALSWLLPSPA